MLGYRVRLSPCHDGIEPIKIATNNTRKSPRNPRILILPLNQ